MKYKSKLSILLIAAAVLLTSCSSLVKITYKDGKYIDKSHDITYLAAEVNYEPIVVGTSYAQYKDTVLYRVKGLEPAEYLTEYYNGVGSMYYSDKIKLPSLSEFGATQIYICSSDNITMHLCTIDDKETVDTVIKTLLEGEPVELPPDGVSSYHLKFKSDTYPAFYYDILYVVGKNAEKYLYDRSTKHCVDAGTLISEYLPTE